VLVCFIVMGDQTNDTLWCVLCVCVYCVRFVRTVRRNGVYLCVEWCLLYSLLCCIAVLAYRQKRCSLYCCVCVIMVCTVCVLSGVLRNALFVYLMIAVCCVLL
jgi:hypothetical protein